MCHIGLSKRINRTDKVYHSVLSQVDGEDGEFLLTNGLTISVGLTAFILNILSTFANSMSEFLSHLLNSK